MRDGSIDEFAGLFERASIPVFDVPSVPLQRISAVLKGHELDASVLKLAGYLRDRFKGEVRLHWPESLTPDRIDDLAGEQPLARAEGPFASTAALAEQIEGGASELVILPVPDDETARVIGLDALVEALPAPVLLFRSAIGQPREVFEKILHSLTGNFMQTENFAYSFTLCAGAGTLHLLHIIEETDVDDVREALRASPDITSMRGDELLEELGRHGGRYLKGVVAASRDLPYEVTYRILLGEVLATVERTLGHGGYGMLVVGAHREGRSHVDAADYHLMHRVRDLPVLAL